MTKIRNAIPGGTLEGSASQTQGLTNQVDAYGGTPNVNFDLPHNTYVASTQHLTVNVTPPANSVAWVILKGVVGAGNNAGPGSQLRRGTTNLLGVTLGGNAIYFDATPGTSATSYNVLNGTTEAYLTYASLTVVFVTLSDTHAAVGRTGAPIQ